MHYTYTAVIERTKTGYSAYLPDLPGCVATGQNAEEAIQQLREAARMHIAGMLEDGEEVPPPVALTRTVDFDLNPA